MPIRCKDIIGIMESLAPINLKAEYDNVGLIIGDEEAVINNILVSLDINDDVIDEAIENRCDMIITHHPLIFHPIKKLNAGDPKQRQILRLVSSGINVYAAHTNLDASEVGINAYLAEKLKLSDISVLESTYTEMLYKIAVYVPEGYEDSVREAMTIKGAGHIGNYGSCTYNIKGEGTFMPLEGSSPFIGQRGVLEHVKEVKIETIARESMLNDIISSMLKAHPYEEPAYDVYLLKNEGKAYGYGRMGYLQPPVTLRDLCALVKDALNIESVNVVGDLDKIVKKVGICSGNGSSLIDIAYKLGTDAYITGDIKYHDACDARDLGLCLIDAGHFATENIYMPELVKKLNEKIYSLNSGDVYIKLSQNNKDPFIKV